MEGALLVSLLVLGSLTTVQCQYQCYTCSSSNDKRCGDYFQPLVPSYPCQGTCLKYRGERWSHGVRTVEVNRLCGAIMSEGCSDGIYYNGLNTRRCACNSNLCNHSNKISSSWIVAVMTACVAGYTIL